MPITSKHATLDYDPSFVFRSYNTNLPHLNTWIDELIHLTESNFSNATNPSTEQLVQSLKRYDTIFCELIRHNTIFSESNSKLFGKTWNGAFKLLNYTIKSYHRYVKHTQHLQTQAQQLLNERLAQMAATKVREEEFELEQTALRARVRNLEAEVESLKASNRSLDRENSCTRTIINTYIKNDELNDRIWDLIEDLGNDLVEVVPENNGNDIFTTETAESVSSKRKAFGFKRKDAVDTGRFHHRQLSKLDVEMNALLSSIIEEENRQLILTQDLHTLMSQHQDVFGKGYWSNKQYFSGGLNEITMCDVGIQTDMKDKYGVVEDLVSDRIEDYAMIVSTLPLPPKVSSFNMASIESKIKGVEYPYHIRRMMNSFPRVLRIPPIVWTCETIFAIYNYMMVKEFKYQSGPFPNQHQDMHTSSICYMTYHYFHDTQEISTTADMLLATFLKSCEYHHKSSKRVYLYANQIGLFEKDHVLRYDTRDTRVILSILDRCYHTAEDNTTSSNVTTNQINLGSIVSSTAQTTVHNKGQLRTSSPNSVNGGSSPFPSSLPLVPQLNSGPGGSSNNNNSNGSNGPSRPGTRDGSTIVTGRYHLAPINSSGAQSPHISALMGEFSGISTDHPFTVPTPSSSNGNNLYPTRRLSNLKPDISRLLAVNVTQAMFSKISSNGGLDLMIRVNSLPSTSQGQDYINIDDLIILLLEAWKSIRQQLEDHAKFLFHMFSSTYRVVSEAQFTSDSTCDGVIVSDKDTVVVQIPKGVAIDLPRRPLRLFTKQSRLREESILKGGNNSIKDRKENHRMQLGELTILSAKKENVCELLTQNTFVDIIKLVYPSMKVDEISLCYSDGCEWSHRQVLRVLENLWIQSIDDTDTGVIRRQDLVAQAANNAAESLRRAMTGDTNSQFESDSITPKSIDLESNFNPNSNLEILSNIDKLIEPDRTDKTKRRLSTLSALAEVDIGGPVRKATQKPYYLNTETGLTQWTPPYRPKTFHSLDLEMDAFITVMLHHDFLLKSPLRQLILLTQPKDLWPNIESFIKPNDNSISSNSGAVSYGLNRNPSTSSNFDINSVSLSRIPSSSKPGLLTDRKRGLSDENGTGVGMSMTRPGTGSDKIGNSNSNSNNATSANPSDRTRKIKKEKKKKLGSNHTN